MKLIFKKKIWNKIKLRLVNLSNHYELERGTMFVDGEIWNEVVAIKLLDHLLVDIVDEGNDLNDDG